MTTRHPASASAYLACYACYAAVLALCVLNFVVWQRATLFLAALVVGEGFSLPVVHGAAVLVGTLALFGVAMAAEPYLRAGVRRRALVRRFARVAVGLVVALALGVAVSALASRTG